MRRPCPARSSRRPGIAATATHLQGPGHRAGGLAIGTQKKPPGRPCPGGLVGDLPVPRAKVPKPVRKSTRSSPELPNGRQWATNGAFDWEQFSSEWVTKTSSQVQPPCPRDLPSRVPLGLRDAVPGPTLALAARRQRRQIASLRSQGRGNLPKGPRRTRAIPTQTAPHTAQEASPLADHHARPARTAGRHPDARPSRAPGRAPTDCVAALAMTDVEGTRNDVYGAYFFPWENQRAGQLDAGDSPTPIGRGPGSCSVGYVGARVGTRLAAGWA